MLNKFSRRTVLQMTMAAGAASMALRAVQVRGDESTGLDAAVKPDQLTPYLYGGQVLLRLNNFVVAAYRANPLQKFPYFSDLAGPASGLPLTTESSEPYPHHRGVWLGCEPLCGGDYWKDGALDQGQIRSLSLSVGKATPTSVELLNRCQWIRRGEGSPFIDERQIEFKTLDDRVRVIDFDVQLTACRDVRIAKAKHSFFALRVAPDLAPDGGGTLINSEKGVGEAGTFGKPANWCGYFGRRAHRPDVVEGLALMDHPENPWAPCPWFTRDYGHLSPSPFNFLDRPWEIKEGVVMRLRYRVVLHAGDPQEAELDRIYKDWIAT